MHNYSKFSLFLLISLCYNSTALADEAYQLSKAALQCLYAQSQALLTEAADPVVILVTEKCTIDEASASTLAEQQALPVLEVGVDPAAADPLSPDDVLIISKAQLQCFQQQFAQWAAKKSDPLTVYFSENCPPAI